MIAGLNVLETILLFGIYILAGRRLSYYPALHRVRPPKLVRRLLFIIDLNTEEINICGIIWQAILIITTITFLVEYFLVGTYISREDYSYLTGVIILVEWLAIGVPMVIYCGICELIKRRK